MNSCAVTEEFFVEVLGDVLTSPSSPLTSSTKRCCPRSSRNTPGARQPAVLGYDSSSKTAYRQRCLGHSLFASPSSPSRTARPSTSPTPPLPRSTSAVLGTGIDSNKLSQLVGAHFADLAPPLVSTTAAK